MGRLLAHDIESSRRIPPGEKLLQALDLMRIGTELKREQIRKSNPQLTDAELEAKLKQWLARDEQR